MPRVKLTPADIIFDEEGYQRINNDIPDARRAAISSQYVQRYQAYKKRGTTHAKARQEFFLLCMLRHGDFGITSLRKLHAADEPFSQFRAEVHPDYFISPALPVLDLDDYVTWYREARGLGSLPAGIKDDPDDERE